MLRGTAMCFLSFACSACFLEHLFGAGTAVNETKGPGPRGADVLHERRGHGTDENIRDAIRDWDESLWCH